MASIDERDYRVVKCVAQFKQMTNVQLHEMLFNGSSRNPVDRTLKRLVERRYLARIERRTVGGAKGGSGQYVYQLGRAGHFLFRDGRYSEWKSINYHALAIADAHLQFLRLERAGKLVIVGFSCEPDCHRIIGDVDLRPDIYEELSKPGAILRAWLEIDLSTEGQKQIRGKLDKYYQARIQATVEDMPEWPRIYWVTVDDWRAKELRWIISQTPPEQQQLFRVIQLTSIPAIFS